MLQIEFKKVWPASENKYGSGQDSSCQHSSETLVPFFKLEEFVYFLFAEVTAGRGGLMDPVA